MCAKAHSWELILINMCAKAYGWELDENKNMWFKKNGGHLVCQ